MLGLVLCYDEENVERRSPQVIRCILCYASLMNNFNLSTKNKIKYITYYKTHGIINLKKHVDIDHVIIEKTFEEEVNNVKFFLMKNTNQRKCLMC